MEKILNKLVAFFHPPVSFLSVIPNEPQFLVTEPFNKARFIAANGKEYSSDKYGDSARTVFIFDDFVIKTDRADYQTQTEQEIKFYEQILEKEDAQYFPKMLNKGTMPNGKPFIVQEKIEILAEEATQAQVDIFEYLDDKYMIGGDIGMSEGNVPFNATVTKDGGIMIYDIGWY